MTFSSTDCVDLLILTVVCGLVHCQQTRPTCPAECPDSCTDEGQCCHTGYYWRDDSVAIRPTTDDISTDFDSTATTFPVTSSEPVTSGSQCHACWEAIDHCEVCKLNFSSDEVVCIQCKDGLQPSPYGDRCDPTDYTTPEWFIPVIVVNAVILAVLIFGVIALVIYRRSSASTRQPRPPLPRPEELDDLPSSRNSKKHRRSTVKRERYTPTPSNSNQLPPQQGTTTIIGGQRDRVPSVLYENREDVLSSTSSKSRRPADVPAVTQTSSPSVAAASAATRLERTAPTKTKRQIRPPPQEIYANCAEEDGGEIYANEVDDQPTYTNDVPGTADRQDDEDDDETKEYQNVNEVNPAAEQPHVSDEDHQSIYQNVTRKPAPAPKPTRRF